MKLGHDIIPRTPGTIEEHGHKDITGKEFITSDLHFFHKNIIQYTGRPFYSEPQMRQTLIANWNATVEPDDIIFILGDVAFGNATAKHDLIPLLNGYKIFIKGNHDCGRTKMIEYGCSEAYLTISGRIKNEQKDCSFKMMHVPLGVEARKVDILLCGHVHEKWCFSAPNVYNVGTDQWDFTPQTINHVLDHAVARQLALPIQLNLGMARTEHDDQVAEDLYERKKKDA